MSMKKILQTCLLCCLTLILMVSCVQLPAYAGEKSYYEVTENTSDDTFNIILLGGGGDNQVFVNGESFGPVTVNNILKAIDETKINVLAGHSTGANQVELFIRDGKLQDEIDMFVFIDAQAYVEDERYCLGDTERPLLIFISDQMNRINWYTFKQQYTNYEIYHMKGTQHVNIVTEYYNELIEIIHKYYERHDIDGTVPKEERFERTKHNSETFDLTAELTWNDAEDSAKKRPYGVYVTLYADDEEVEKQRITPDDNGRYIYTFEALPKCKKGVEVDYYMEEKNLPDYTNNDEIDYRIEVEEIEGYETEISETDSGFVIRSTYTPATVTVSGNIVWMDSNDQAKKRPSSVTVYVMNGDTIVTEKTVSAKNDWKWSVKLRDLSQNYNGAIRTYTYKAVTVPDYSISVAGTTITFTLNS